mmetsp:Transcript_73537/g.102118  ORF Transcript_73537/g.102118 Transcript_73537/m.102118 type:complete len:237 (-) Transcript_73537:13-723(-)
MVVVAVLSDVLLVEDERVGLGQVLTKQPLQLLELRLAIPLHAADAHQEKLALLWLDAVLRIHDVALLPGELVVLRQLGHEEAVVLGRLAEGVRVLECLPFLQMRGLQVHVMTLLALVVLVDVEHVLVLRVLAEQVLHRQRLVVKGRLLVLPDGFQEVVPAVRLDAHAHVHAKGCRAKPCERHERERRERDQDQSAAAADEGRGMAAVRAAARQHLGRGKSPRALYNVITRTGANGS